MAQDISVLVVSQNDPPVTPEIREQILIQDFKLPNWFQKFYRFTGGGLNSTSNVVESIWPLPKLTILIVRIIIALFVLGTFILRIVIWFEDGRHFFFFTNLTYISIFFYFALVIWYTWRSEYGKGRISNDIEMKDLDPRVSVGDLSHPDSARNQFLCWIISSYFAITTASTFLITIVYWSLLREEKDTPLSVFTNVCAHILNVVFMIMELSLNAMKVSPFVFIFDIMLSFLYFFWVWIGTAIWESPTFPNERFWTYRFLQFSSPTAIIYYFAIPIGGFILQILVWALVLLKFKIASLSKSKVSPINQVS